MRIVAGHLRSRRLASPPESVYLRPTTDIVRESLFNILSNRISFEGIPVADIFCGTGSLGLECISRGASGCVFVDKDISYAKKNSVAFGVDDICRFVKSDAIKFLLTSDKNQFDIIFADPPYIYDKYEVLIKAASEHNALFVLEHHSGEKFSSESDKILLKKKHGISEITIYNFREKNEE